MSLQFDSFIITQIHALCISDGLAASFAGLHTVHTPPTSNLHKEPFRPDCIWTRVIKTQITSSVHNASKPDLYLETRRIVFTTSHMDIFILFKSRNNS